MARKVLFIFLLFLVLASIFLRFYRIGAVPVGFFCDEAAIGYNAYSLLKTGFDEYNQFMPLFFRSFGEYKGFVQIYLTVVPVFLFGLNEYATRLTSGMLGMVSAVAIVLFFLNTYRVKLRHFDKLTLIFIVLSNPWHFHFSRIAFEPMAFLSFLVLGSLLMLHKKCTVDYRYYALGLFFLIVSIYSNFPARIVGPLYLAIIIFFTFSKVIFNLKRLLFTFMLGLILITPIVIHVFFGPGWERYRQVGIFADGQSQMQLEEKISLMQRKYLDHFSFDFLFLKGDIDMKGQFITRHSVREFGQFYIFEFLLMIIGVVFAIRSRKFGPIIMTLAMLAVYPVANMLTADESIQSTRAIVGILPFSCLIFMGVVFIVKRLNYLKYFLIVIYLVFFASYSNKYFFEYPKYSSDFWGWQYGPGQIMKYFKSNQHKHSDLIMSGDFNAPDIFIKFYDPKNVCLDKCYVSDINNLRYGNLETALLSVSWESFLKDNLKNKMKVEKVVFYPNQKPAFVIGTL